MMLRRKEIPHVKILWPVFLTQHLKHVMFCYIKLRTSYTGFTYNEPHSPKHILSKKQKNEMTFFCFSHIFHVFILFGSRVGTSPPYSSFWCWSAYEQCRNRFHTLMPFEAPVPGPFAKDMNTSVYPVFIFLDVIFPVVTKYDSSILEERRHFHLVTTSLS